MFKLDILLEEWGIVTVEFHATKFLDGPAL